MSNWVEGDFVCCAILYTQCVREYDSLKIFSHKAIFHDAEKKAKQEKERRKAAKKEKERLEQMAEAKLCSRINMSCGNIARLFIVDKVSGEGGGE